MTHRLRRGLAVGILSLGFVAVAAGTANAAATENPAGSPQDTVNGVQSALCAPEGSILRPTLLCEIPDPNNVEESINPYSPDGESHGLLGLGVLRLL